MCSCSYGPHEGAAMPLITAVWNESGVWAHWGFI